MFAIIEYGSAVRGGNDLHSDKDLLIVCDRKLHQSIREYYERAGYSVSAFTFTQLQLMQKKGSLFIQHLKLESRALIDTRDHFKKWLRTCDLKPPSNDEISKCIQAIQFISMWPVDKRLSSWKADFLYCVSRDLLVKSLASHGILAFGISDIEREFQALYRCMKFDFGNLESLRRIKSAYRSGSAQPAHSDTIIHTWLSEISTLFSLCISEPYVVSSEEFVTTLKSREFTSQYELLRTLEAAYAILRFHGFIHDRHTHLMQCIIRPNIYGSSQVHKFKSLSRYFADIIDIMANKVLRTDQIALS